VKRYKAHLVDNGYTQNEGFDFRDTFSLLSSKDSFKRTMTLVTHYNLELHQIDVKTTFLNDNIDETIYIWCN